MTGSSGTSSAGAGSSGGSSGGATGGAGSGTTGSDLGSACKSDLECSCGEICASGYGPHGAEGIAANTCIVADGGQIGDTGLCAVEDAGEGSCHYEGQTCHFDIPLLNGGDYPPYCFPAWSPSSVCLGDGGTTTPSKSGCNTALSGDSSLVLAFAALGLWASRRRRDRPIA
jgi:MYXO-CTERM domain-containing protein